MISIEILILILIIFLCVFLNFKEHFDLIVEPTRFEFPTRNMSYDLRGEAYYPPRVLFPFDNSEIGPLIN